MTPSKALDSELRTYRIRRKLTRQANRFLQDHVIGKHAVLPVTCSVAWMANTGEQLYPGYTFFSCDNYKVLKGIIFDDTLAATYVLDLKEINKSPGEIDLAITIWSETSAGSYHYHYSGQIKLLRHILNSPIYADFDDTEDHALTEFAPYQNGTLFHGTCFQGVKRLLNISRDRLTLECLCSEVDIRQQGQFPVETFNPYIADMQFQCMLIWVRHFYQAASLPLGCRRGEHFRHIPWGERFYVSMDVCSHSTTKLVANITSHDRQGNVYIQAFGAEAVISSQLNFRP